MPDTGLPALFLVGLLGGVHCIGMCGGIVGALAGQLPARRSVWPIHLAYNAGRLVSYALAGAAAGALGGIGRFFAPLAAVQLAFYLLASLLLVALGMYLMGHTAALAPLERAGQWLWRRLQPLATGLLPVRGIRQALPLGMLWGWLPCGLVYGVLGSALVAGSPGRGALCMLAFGLGTLPNLLLAGVLLSRFRRFAQARAVRLTCGLIVLSFGLYGLARAANFGRLLWQGQLAGS